MISGRKKSVGLLAGTFDPVHVGHIALADSALQGARLDEVWFVADPKVNNIASEQKRPAASYEARIKMLETAVADYPHFKVYDGVLASSAHTSQMFLDLISFHPENGFTFVLGADTFERMTSWQDIESVVQNATFAAGIRAHLRDGLLTKVRSDLGSVASDLSVTWLNFDGFKHVSSTRVRMELSRTGRSADLDPEVLAYIKDNYLYQ
jgi:nicotinate-nucleotide adenylyltransferase